MAFDSPKLELVQQLDSAVSKTETQGTLRPITSNDTGRYERTGLAEPYNIQISSGLFTHSRLPEPSYLPENWSAHIHPEGQLYFHRDGPLRVVTEAYLYRKETLELATYWIKKIEDAAAERNFPISNQVELFIKLEEENCAYYFVDHATRAQSWMEDIDSEDLGFPPVVSVSQLNILCEEQYWTHVEHFPMHIGLPPPIVDQLICVLTHAICDQMTSRVSTFPYSQKECEGFNLKIHVIPPDHSLSDGNIVCTVARLWGVVIRNRYLTHYGQEFSRLSRDQAVLFDPATKHTWVRAVASRLSFGTSDRYLAQLDDVFVDHLVYSEQWKTMATGCLKDWRRASYTAFFGLMLHIFFLSLKSCPSLAVASGMFFGASLFGSTFLTHKYEPLQDITAGQAMDYLESIQSPTFKFQFVALVYAVPHTLNLWGTLAVFANCICMLATYFGTAFAGAISVMALIAVLLIQWTTSARFNTNIARIQAKFSRDGDASYISMV